MDFKGSFAILSRPGALPVVYIVVPFFVLTNSIVRILKGNPQKELEWRL